MSKPKHKINPRREDPRAAAVRESMRAQSQKRPAGTVRRVRRGQK